MIYKLKPILKYRLWGGNYLPKILNVSSNEKIGEAWILSCIGDNNSLVDEKTTLLDLFKQNPNIVADGYKGDFPLLIKLIDAQDDLSIQVHPNIKTEFWHILNDKPSKLYMGFKQDTNKSEVEKLLNQSQIASILNHVDVKNGDSYLINPGTIHAIGKKTFLIEIQQSADITYRLFDYNRIDNNGQKRPLHINDALSCINYQKFNAKKHPNDNQLIQCPYFAVYKHKISAKAKFEATKKSFNSIVILSGNGYIKTSDQNLAFKPYDSFFISAGSGSYEIIGDATIIRVTL